MTTTRKPGKKHFRDTASRLRKGKASHISHRASLDWRRDHRAVCAQDAGGAHDAPPIGELSGLLRKSRTGAALLESQEARGLRVCYDAQSPGSQYYPPREGRDGTITLNPGRPRGDLLVMLARELRRAWQHHEGALVNPLCFDPDEAILVNRAQTADAFIMAIRVAWELKLAGEQEAWNWIAGSPVADLGRAFEIRAQTDFRTLNNGKAARAAYDRFFEDGRTKACDKRIIHQMLLDENGYMRAHGRPQKVSDDLFRKLGETPGGASNYLLGRGGAAPLDPRYTAVEDRSNANFLWFIKFERSFQEKELQMLKDSVRLSAEIVDFAKWSMSARGGETPRGGL